MDRILTLEASCMAPLKPYAVVVTWDSYRGVTLYTYDGSFSFDRDALPTVPKPDRKNKWSERVLTYAEAMGLEELLLFTRLPLAVPGYYTLDGTLYRLGIREDPQYLLVEWGGDGASLLWHPLDELVNFLRALRPADPGSASSTLTDKRGS